MNRETHHHHYRWLAGRTWLGVWVIVLVVLGFVVAANAQRGTRLQTAARTATAPSPLQSIASSAAIAPGGVATNRPVIASFAWDASPDSAVTNYSLHWGVRSRTYTNSARFGTNLSGTLSNQFVRGVKYYVAVTAQDRAGIESIFSNEAIWPVPLTNYVGVVVSARTNSLTAPARTIFATVIPNPPGESVFFETQIWQTNDFATVTRINTRTLKITNTNAP